MEENQPNFKNLTKLAEELQYVPAEQFSMSEYQRVTNNKLFAKFHPNKTNVYRGHTFPMFSPDTTFKMELGCGTSACAMGWAPTLVKKGKKGENFEKYSWRVFGLIANTSEWNFMFAGSWRGVEDSPKNTVERIKYYVKNRSVPSGWCNYKHAMLESPPVPINELGEIDV